MFRSVPRFTAVLLTGNTDKMIVIDPNTYNFGFLIDGSIDY